MKYTACGGRRRRHGRKHTMKGGVYEQNVSESVAGFPVTKSVHEVEAADFSSRGGNNTFGGRRRHRKSRRGGKRRGRKHTAKRGGGGSYGTPIASDLALNVPRAGYGYTGTGVAGFTDPTPIY